MPKRQPSGDSKRNCYICLVVLAVIFGSMFYINFITSGSVFFTPSTGGQDTQTQTLPATNTTTTTTEPTTTVTEPPSRRYVLDFKYDWIPIMQVTPPSYIILGIQENDELGNPIESIYATIENVWFAGYVPLTVGTFVRIDIAGPPASGWADMELDGENYIVIQAGGSPQSYDMIVGGQDWGNCWVQWVEVVG